MRLLHCIHDGVQFFLSGLVYAVLIVDTRNRTVRGHDNNVHAIDIPELLFLRERRTGHTAFFAKFIEKILERDGGKRLALSLYLDVFFCLDCLMQTIRIAAPGHDSSGKFVNNQYLVVLYHVILVAEHQVMRAQRKHDVVLYLKIFGIGEVVNLEELLYPVHACCREVDDLVLLIDNEIPCLFLLDTHDKIHLGHFRNVLATLHLSGKNIADFIKFCGFAALS